MNRLPKRLESLRHLDPKKNEESSPPEEEEIKLVCLWAVEFYSPAHTDNLIASLQSLGWKKYKDDDSNNPSLWLDRLKARQQDGWMDLGILIPDDAETFIGMNRHTVPLPEHVSYAIATLHAMTPSLNCITVCFVFDETSEHSPATAFEEALRSHYHTYGLRIKNGWRIFNPHHQKAERVRAIRTALSGEALRWFTAHFPGLFSSGVLAASLPTCEFIVTKEAEPFLSEFSGWQSRQAYASILGLDNYAVWKHQTLPVGIRFPFAAAQDDYHVVVAGKKANLLQETANNPETPTIKEKIFQLNTTVSVWFSVWALLPLLEGYTRRIIQVRDSSFLRSQEPRGKWATSVLERLEAYMMSSVDISAVTKELGDKESVERMLWSVDDFQSIGDASDQDIPLKSFIVDDVSHRAKWIQATDSVLRDQLAQYGSLIGATENVRLQKRISLLTWLLVLFASITIYLTYQSI